jgi:hypothetical protein
MRNFLSALLVVLFTPAAIAQVNTFEFRQHDLENFVAEFGVRSKTLLTVEAVQVLRNTGQGEWIAAVQMLPRIHLVVNPVPPRDYVVKINGREYPATPESMYGVAPGSSVEVVVTRGTLQPCERTLVVRKDETVTCEFRAKR